MNCWHCNDELIWGGDHDIEDSEDYDIVSNLSCPTCNSYVEVYATITGLGDLQMIRRPKLDQNENYLGTVYTNTNAGKWPPAGKPIRIKVKNLESK
tara:strand:+ start:640 stop:927 length:288 start_codon:yes stop_codon:yes gene_type:complete